MPIDSKNNFKVTKVIGPLSPSATGTMTGTVVDTAGYRSNTFLVEAGLQTTANLTVVPVVLSGTATDALTSAADSTLIGTEAAANLSGTAGASGRTKIGYIGSNRYVRCDLAVANAATGVYSVTLIQGDPIKAPVS